MQLRNLFIDFPQLRWLLVGDDGQHDPLIMALLPWSIPTGSPVSQFVTSPPRSMCSLMAPPVPRPPRADARAPH